MPSPRTEADVSTAGRWARFDPRGRGAIFQRLNVRLILALAIVALVSLVVSGVAITQILPGHFAEQTQERIQTAAGSTGILLREEITRVGEIREASVVADETRNTFLVPQVAAAAARVFNATVTILDAEGRTVTVAMPPDVASLEAQGLKRDTGVTPVRALVDVEIPDGTQRRYQVIISDPYSTREETLSQIGGALLGAGFLALGASLVTGLIAARSVTVPISRLRGVAGRVAQGQMDERAVPSGVLEVDELGQQFNVMADRLAGTLRMLEADRDRLRAFVADVSHELRTPIAALRLYTELQHDGDVDEPTRREFLESSLEQIGRLEWLSTNLLDLSRIDAGIYPLDIREGDLRDPVQAVVQALSEVAVHRGVALDSVVPAEPVEMRFDRERIVQLMTNLVGNALKFTPTGGAVSVRIDEREDDVTVEVSDTGHGIPADELPRIFDRFYRGTNTGEARASGSGLGLAIVRSIVELHGGEIDLASEVGGGTQVRITLARGPVDDAGGPGTSVNETSRGAQPAHNPGPAA
ncbi:MAG: HAMP domain-containing histidine kinase [Chloroflexi bacterium]|nr:HAMP domain-containing histidine kinase [Chloroflexota bacterium]